MSDIELSNITSGYNLNKINDNFQTIQEVVNDEILHTEGGNNTMEQALDMNSYPVINGQTDVSDPTQLLTVKAADARYNTKLGNENTSGLGEFRFNSVDQMKSMTDITANIFTESDVAALADSGAVLHTNSYYAGTYTGGGTYILRTRSAHRTAIGDNGWEPDGYGDHYLLGGTDYVAVLQHNKYVDVQCFGARGDMVGDSSPAIQAAIDYVVYHNLSTIRLPQGHYRIAQSLNCTQGSVSIIGDSRSQRGSVLVGETGEDFVLDYTGSLRHVTLKDFYINSSDLATTNPSVNGVLFARTSAGTLNGEHVFHNLGIRLVSDTAANGGFGGIGFCSIASESNVFIGTYFVADVPAVFISNPEIHEYVSGAAVTITTIASQHATISSTSASNTENFISGVFVSRTGVRPAVHITNGASYTFTDAFISRFETPAGEVASTAPPAVLLNNCTGINLAADIEGYRVYLGLRGFNNHHKIELYAPQRDGYPLIKAMERLTGEVVTMNSPYIRIAPTFSSQNTAATFIDDQVIIRVLGGELVISCPLELTQPLSILQGTVIDNPKNLAVTTSNSKTAASHSSYQVRCSEKTITNSPTLTERFGVGYTDVEYPFFVSSIVLPGTPSRTTRTFKASNETSRGVIRVRGVVESSTTASLDLTFLYNRTSEASPYTITGTQDNSFDPDGRMTALTVTPNVVSAIGDTLEVSLTFTLASGSIVSICGTTQIMTRW